MADELMTDRYREIPGGLLCLKCGSFVPNAATETQYAWEIHDKWHEHETVVAEGARWGDMNRPIGGYHG
jgi:hypothetical protein